MTNYGGVVPIVFFYPFSVGYWRVDRTYIEVYTRIRRRMLISNFCRSLKSTNVNFNKQKINPLNGQMLFTVYSVLTELGTDAVDL